MTREEAIKDIQENIKPFVGGKSLDMAIEALKAEPIVRCKDCRYCSITPVATVGATYECLRFRKRFGITIHMMPTDFCSKGRRRPAK